MARRFGKRNTRGGKNIGWHGSDKRWEGPDGRVWDSQLEGLIAAWMDGQGILYTAQPDVGFGYETKVRNGHCKACQGAAVVQLHSYTPDFWLPDHGFYIEVKGYFRQGVRPAMQEFIKQNREIPLRFVFSRNNKLPLKRTPNYLSWAEYYGCPALTWNEKRGLSEWFS